MRGGYVLIARLGRDSKIGVGALGELNFKKGCYAYVGSAMGRGKALENRIKRHRKLANKKRGKLFWHIDYFLARPNVKIEKVLVFESDKRIECQISKKLSKLARKTIKGFGSSDCRCEGHLHHLGKTELINFSLLSLDPSAPLGVASSKSRGDKLEMSNTLKRVSPKLSL